MIISLVTFITCLLLGLITVQVMYEYLFLVAATCLKRPERIPLQPKLHRFAALIPAHNEQAVIVYLIDSLRRCKYPAELIEIFVIADNCTDETAMVAFHAGAVVLERQDREQSGKPFAISWALRQPEIVSSRYDAVVIFDADNVIHPDFFEQANLAMNGGAKVFQCVVETKNRLDSWVTAGNYITFAVLNRITQAGRSRLGLGVHLFGTGMGFARDLFEIVPWNAESLTEDKEYTYKLLLKGIKVVWLEKAVVYDEKTTTAKESFHQQSRWLSGYYADFRKYAPLFLRALKDRFDWSYPDTLYHMVQPFMPGKNLGALILLLLVNKLLLWVWWGGLFLASFGIQLAALVLNHTRIAEYRFLLFLYPYRALSLMVSIMTLLLGPDHKWRHTKHTRGVGIDGIS